MISIILNESWEAALFEAAFAGEALTLYPAGTPASAVDPATTVLSVFIHTPIRAADMQRLPNLRLIAIRATGYDHVDVADAAARGVTVCNVPAYGERTVAEYAMALVLACSRLIIPSTLRLKQEWSKDLHDLRGVDLYGKTIGIVGTGLIGRNFGRMTTGFKMRIIAHDLAPNLEWAEEVGAQYVPLTDVYAQADIISFHAPLLPSTHHLFNMQSLPLLKSGVIIVNTSRGALVENAALLAGLDQGLIRAAGLDVIEHEAMIGSGADTPEIALMHQLLDHPRVIASAHNAFNSAEALERIITTTIDTIRQVQAGMAPQYVVMAR
ncbi:MAG: hydroxyacid dehydrogenase [Chloroflexi bacterium]|nr:hydroxyacid dehydrogenase [Chloroflexota bacterium]